MRCLAAYVGERTITVKLGATVSSTRALSIGLPQSSGLSHTPFNAVMFKIAPYILRALLVSATVYDEDVCLQVCGIVVKPM